MTIASNISSRLAETGSLAHVPACAVQGAMGSAAFYAIYSYRYL
ncbi:hypothetical protein [Slackia equolifaciens]|nr:hypothetical protein [Slackia equolifaciens]